MSLRKKEKVREEGELSSSDDNSDFHTNIKVKKKNKFTSLSFSSKHASFREEGELSDSSEQSSSDEDDKDLEINKQVVSPKKKLAVEPSKHFSDVSIKTSIEFSSVLKSSKNTKFIDQAHTLNQCYLNKQVDNAVQEKQVSTEKPIKHVSFIEDGELSESFKQSYISKDISVLSSPTPTSFVECDNLEVLKQSDPKKCKDIAEVSKVFSLSVNEIPVDSMVHEKPASLVPAVKHLSFIEEIELSKSCDQSHISKDISNLPSFATSLENGNLQPLNQFNPEENKNLVDPNGTFSLSVDEMLVDNDLNKKHVSAVTLIKHVSISEELEHSQSSEQSHINKDISVLNSPSLTTFLEIDYIQPLKQSVKENDEDIAEESKEFSPSIEETHVMKALEEKPVSEEGNLLVSYKSFPEHMTFLKDDKLTQSPDHSKCLGFSDQNESPPVIQSTTFSIKHKLDLRHDGGGIETSDVVSCDEPPTKRLKKHFQSNIKLNFPKYVSVTKEIKSPSSSFLSKHALFHEKDELSESSEQSSCEDDKKTQLNYPTAKSEKIAAFEPLENFNKLSVKTSLKFPPVSESSKNVEFTYQAHTTNQSSNEICVENVTQTEPDSALKFIKHVSFFEKDQVSQSPEQSHVTTDIYVLNSPTSTAFGELGDLELLKQSDLEKDEDIDEVIKECCLSVTEIPVGNEVHRKPPFAVKSIKHVSFLAEGDLSHSTEQSLSNKNFNDFKDISSVNTPNLISFLENDLKPLKKSDPVKVEDIAEGKVQVSLNSSPEKHMTFLKDDRLSPSPDYLKYTKVPDEDEPPPLMQSTNLPLKDGLDFRHDGGGIETSDSNSCDKPPTKRMKRSSQHIAKPCSAQIFPSYNPEASAEDISHPCFYHTYSMQEKVKQEDEEIENYENDDDDDQDLSDSRMMEFDILDEFESNDDDNDQRFSSDEDSDISLNELDALLEADLENRKHSENTQFFEDFEHEEKQKVILKVRNRDHFDVLPEGWIEVTHNSGMPVYLHKATRVCCVSKPYFLGPGSTRKHEIPVSAIPCLQYLKDLEKEKNETLKTSKTAEDVDSFPSAKLESVKETKESGSLSHLAVRDYCKKRFEFQTITVKRFKTWSGRRLHQKQAKQKQRPTLPDSTKLITCPLPLAHDKAAANGNNHKREFIMNPSGKSPVCILHEYVQHTLRVQPRYVFKELENASTPYGAVLMINEIQYGSGYGSSKKQAKSEAAKAALEVLIPKMRMFSVDTVLGEDQQDVEFFDQVRVEDPRVCELSVKAGQPYPYQILLECLKRNYGMGDTEIDFKMRNLKHQKNEFVMTVGRHTAAVVCKNKRDGKHRASQAILQKLHPHIISWGSLLRMYGKGSVKTLKEKKEEEQRITELQSKACANKPNLSILNKLKEEMLKYRKRMKLKKPIGKLIPEQMRLTTSDSNLKNVDL